MNLLENVLKEIKPTEEERGIMLSETDKVIKEINSRIKHAEAILGGSGAKGTWLKGMHDADIFVLFDYERYKDRSSELADILENTLKRIFK